MDEGDICDSNLTHALKGKANPESASRSVPNAANEKRMGKCRNQLRWGVAVVEVRGQGRGIVNTRAIAWGQFGTCSKAGTEEKGEEDGRAGARRVTVQGLGKSGGW